MSRDQNEMLDDPRERFNWRLILACWAVFATLLYASLLPQMGGVLPFTDNDDAMRMVTATDLANGQAWQDTIEHRDDAPFGVPMHWSRLVDAPIAGLLIVTRPLLGTSAANAVAFVWPPVMLLGLLLVSVGLTRRVLGAGHQVPAVVLPLLSMAAFGEFAPGRVDHHNVQMILTTALVWATISGRTRAGPAIIAGLLAATSLAIGIETLPFVVGAVLAFSLFWVRDPAANGAARRFAAAFALGVLLHFVLATPPSRYLASAVDQLSDVYVAAAFLSAGAIWLATAIGRRFDGPRRLLLIAVLGALAIAITVMLFPESLRGPYGRLDARDYALLIAGNPEAQSLWHWFSDDPVKAVSFTSAAFLGLAVIGWRATAEPGEHRTDWLVLLLYLGLAVAVMIIQVRGIRLAIMPAMPAGAWLIGRARASFAARATPWRGGAMVASWVLFAGLLQFIVPSALSALVESTPASAATAPDASAFPGCVLPTAFARLASLPAGVVMAPTSLGPRILRYTSDAVISAGYHRNIDGTLDVDDFLNAGEAAARDIAQRRKLDYVVACRGLAQLMPGPQTKPDSFVAEWVAGRRWDWLTPLSDPNDRIQIFKVELQP